VSAPVSDAQNALVVAATGGIGLGFVDRLLADPTVAQVFATYRNPDKARALREREAAAGGKLHCLPMELTDEEQIRAGIAKLSAATNRLHLAVNCAGLLHDEAIQPEKSLRQLDSDRLLHYFATNSIPIALLGKHLLPLLKHDERSIFASITAKVGSIGDNRIGGWYGYRASKAAGNMFVRTLAIEYRRRSPRTIVVALHPGTTDTPLSKPFQSNVPPEKLFSVEYAVAKMQAVIDGLDSDDSGEFFSWDGSRLPW